MASNYLDIKPLLELACAKVASLIKNKSIQEVRKFFNIENDFSPEEETQIMEENKWAEQSFWRFRRLKMFLCAARLSMGSAWAEQRPSRQINFVRNWSGLRVVWLQDLRIIQTRSVTLKLRFVNAMRTLLKFPIRGEVMLWVYRLNISFLNNLKQKQIFTLSFLTRFLHIFVLHMSSVRL